MPRTNAGAVMGVLGDNYGKNVNGVFPDLTPWITWASPIVDRVKACAAAKGLPLTTAELLNVETFLAAYGYTKMDPTYTSKSTEGASASFVRGSDPEGYKVAAIEADYSGCLNAILKRQFAFGYSVNFDPASKPNSGIL